MRERLRSQLGWALLALLAAAIVFGSLQGGDDGRSPDRDSLDEGRAGFAAWAQLMEEAGAAIERLDRPPSRGGIDPDLTVVALDIGSPTEADTEALREFVAEGGYLITGGNTDPEAVAAITGIEADATGSASGAAAPLVPVAQTEGVASVDPAGGALFEDPGAGLPVLGSPEGDLLLLRRADGGEVALLSSSDPLTNAHIASADNARFAIDLGTAGGPQRGVVFLQSLAVPGEEPEGLGALPLSWRIGFAGLLLAALTFIASRVRRLGPPDGDPTPPAQRRAGYIDAMADNLARSGGLAEAAEPVRRAALEGIGRRAGAPPGTGDEDMLAAYADRAGVPADEAEALAAPLARPEAAIKATRALARVRR